MKSNYKPIGDFIRLVDIRNKELKNLELVGVTVNKRFIPSVANIIGSDMTNYKIIKKNQFACSLMQVRRDGKIPVALFEDNEAIISQAYPVFEIVDTNELLPQYLMMWMTRSEFDRESCFYAVGGVRGSLEWEDFCSMKLPVPTIDKQKEIIKEYHAITDRIKLNEQLNQKLEDTAQEIFDSTFNNENKEMEQCGYFTVDKGSVTVNGVSLTVISPVNNTFTVAIIPYTKENTNFCDIKIGSIVNIEFDILGKYIARLQSI